MANDKVSLEGNMSWERMSIEEYAEFENGNGVKTYMEDGVYWKEVRPFFYRPLLPFVKVVPGEAKLPLSSLLNGFQHPVPSSELANSYINYLLFDDSYNYSFKQLSKRYVRFIRKGLKTFTVKPVSNLDEFVAKGHRLYLSFYKRTHYKWASERIDKRIFLKWGKLLFNFPKIQILGAYRDDELCAISISYLVEDIVMYATFFSHTESLKLKTSDLMLHVVREMASGRDHIKCVYLGLLSSKWSLNEFKIRRGCKIFAEPAYFRINPVLLAIIKRFGNNDYKKLKGLNQEEIDKIWMERTGSNRMDINLSYFQKGNK